jgi:hypothetical protein
MQDLSTAYFVSKTAQFLTAFLLVWVFFTSAGTAFMIALTFLFVPFISELIAGITVLLIGLVSGGAMLAYNGVTDWFRSSAPALAA